MNEEQYLYFLKEKYHKARILDRDFDPKNYLWLLGGNVWTYLTNLYDTVYLRDNEEGTCKLFEIPVRVDISNATEIRLFKEIDL